MVSNVPQNLGKAFRHACEDVLNIAHGSLVPSDRATLVYQLEEMVNTENTLLPASFRKVVLKQFVEYLKYMSEELYQQILEDEEHGHGTQENFEFSQKKKILFIADAFLQRKYLADDSLQRKQCLPSFLDLQAFQAVLKDIYGKMRENLVGKVAISQFEPLARWSDTAKSPQTLTAARVDFFDPGIGIVNMPDRYERGGTIAWAALGHEVAGHNILQSVPGLLRSKKEDGQLNSRVSEAVRECIRNRVGDGDLEKIVSYFKACTEEIASDVMGAFSLGPSFGIAILGFLRGVRKGKLRSSGYLYQDGEISSTSLHFRTMKVFIESVNRRAVTFEKKSGTFGRYKQGELDYETFEIPSDNHPVDILRPFAVCQAISELSCRHVTRSEEEKVTRLKRDWINLIESEVIKDYCTEGEIDLRYYEKSGPGSDSPYQEQHLLLSYRLGVEAMKAAAKAIATRNLPCLQNSSLVETCSWTVEDERLTEIALDRLGPKIKTSLGDYAGCSARHVVAASVIKCLKNDPSLLKEDFERMKTLLYDKYTK